MKIKDIKPDTVVNLEEVEIVDIKINYVEKQKKNVANIKIKDTDEETANLVIWEDPRLDLNSFAVGDSYTISNAFAKNNTFAKRIDITLRKGSRMYKL